MHCGWIEEVEFPLCNLMTGVVSLLTMFSCMKWLVLSSADLLVSRAVALPNAEQIG